jgi:stage II sporulation protein D
VGRGHGLGLCQRGAAAMASEGKNFREILMHYFPNATLESLK